MGERKIAPIGTIALAVLVLISVSAALLVFDPRTTGADALRTGGLAAGSVIALYALWLNDRRRVEENRQELDRRRQELDTERYALEQRRQELEYRRTDHDRDRAADERFARAVELLGDEADQVRVGALHALAGLARTRADYTQTVLDVLCSYLRRPFDHPKWSRPNDVNTETMPGASETVERERTVRQTATRLITQLLPTTADPEPPIYDLDLTYARLELVDLRDKVVGRLAAFSAQFRHTVHLDRARFHGQLRLRDATFVDDLQAREAHFMQPLKARNVRMLRAATFDSAQFLDEVSFRGMRCHERISFQDALFRGAVDLRDAHFERALDLRVREPAPEIALTGAEVHVSATAELPRGWSLTELPNAKHASITPS